MENTVKPLSMSFIPFHSFGTHMGESSQGMFMSESAVIRKIAEDGPCIFLGRCADYALRNNDNHFDIFVCADDDYREKRGQTVYEARASKSSTARTRSVPAITTTTRDARGATVRTTTSSSTRARALRLMQSRMASSRTSTRSRPELD